MRGREPSDFEGKSNGKAVKILSVKPDERRHRIAVLLDISGAVLGQPDAEEWVAGGQRKAIPLRSPGFPVRLGGWCLAVRRGAFPEGDLWSEGWGRAGDGQPISDHVRGNDAKRLDRNRIVGTGKRLEEMVAGIISRQEESPQRLVLLLSTRTRALQRASTLKKRLPRKLGFAAAGAGFPGVPITERF